MTMGIVVRQFLPCLNVAFKRLGKAVHSSYGHEFPFFLDQLGGGDSPGWDEVEEM